MAITFRLTLAGLCVLPITGAWAHAVMERKEASPDTAYRGVVQITHGCAGSPTTRVSVTIPEGVVGAKPMPKPGWQVSTTKGAYAKAYPYYHGTISEGVKSITWTGSALPDDEVDEFTFFARVSDAFAPGQTIYFTVRQDCEKGDMDWNEIPSAGTPSHSLKRPAPGVSVVAAPSAVPQAHAIKAGAISIQAVWSRATPNGAKVAGGYLTVTNTGAEPDRLVGGTFEAATRVEIHRMSMEGDVMRMAPVEGGLIIEPHATVTLKPGGYHLMFLDLKSQLTKGEMLKGSLEFEKAGKVEVDFKVEAIAAKEPEVGHDHH